MKTLTPNEILCSLKKVGISELRYENRNGKDIWRVRVDLNGRLVGKTIKLPNDLNEIKRLVLKTINELKTTDNRLLVDLLPIYAEQHSLADHTVKNYASMLKGFFVNSPEHNLERVKELYKTYHQQRSADAKLSVIQRVFKWARDNGYTTDNPFKTFSKLKQKTHVRNRVLTDSEIKQVRLDLLKSAKTVQLLFEILLTTGARVSTILLLTPESLDENGYLHLINKKVQRAYAVQLPLHQSLFKSWHELATTPNTPIFTENDMYKLRRILRKIPKDPNGETISIHSIRHTFATRALQSGTPLDVVSKLLDHSSPAITLKVYARHSQQQIDEGIKSVFDSLKLN